MTAFSLAILALGAAACSSGDDDEDVGEAVGAQTTWTAPAEGSCQAKAILKVANEATLEQLDVDAKLQLRAAENIIAARPVATVAALDAVGYVGTSALSSMMAYAGEQGHLQACGVSTEIGIVSDLDNTVVPAATPDLSLAPYPGVKALYHLLEFRNQGAAGDVHYVTARTPDKVTEIPAYLAAHGVPAGTIDTGTSGVPWVAQAEKVRDISRILDATGTQRFVLFGDTAHRDPEVYKQILAAYPDRIIAGFIQKVNVTVSPGRVVGLHLHESYAEVAAILYGLEVLSRTEALGVMNAAKSEGLAITAAQMQALLNAHQP